jgi:molybdopterin-guanine dinucleotide biosynthesis protein A
MKITGIILAGGLSSRMGQNKSLVEINGMPMILHVYNKLLPQVSSVLISTNEKLAMFPNDIQFQDQVNDSKGPLAGIYSGLKKAQTPWIQFCPNDSPNLPNDLVRNLSQHIDDQTRIILPIVDERFEPTFMLCHQSIANDIPDFIRNNNPKIMDWIKTHQHKTVQFIDKSEFININSESDLKVFN